jgi:hypothetical protein
MMVCGRIVLKSKLRLRAARQRGAALNVVDLLIIGYLLEDRVVIDGVPTDYRSDMCC